MISLVSNFQMWVDIAQIITAIVTLIGVGLSFWISRKTLQEIQRDRVVGQRPFLLFDYGGYVSTINFKKYEGDSNEYIELFWPPTGNGGVHVVTVGKLKNLGTGPALDVRIRWIVEEVFIKGERFKIDKDKRKESQYLPNNNENPINKSHLYPNEESGFHLIPHFISFDFERKIERAGGYFIISYYDTFENKHETFQKFNVFTDYNNLSQGFHTTFSDLIKKKSHYQK